MPEFVEDIIGRCNLDSNSVVVDLGSGVGNIISQISLLKGCSAYGIEIRSSVAHVADKFIKEVAFRSRIWGVPIGQLAVYEGDLLTHRGIRELLVKADLVIVNNRIFGEKFKESAIIVSLEQLERAGTTRSGRILSPTNGYHGLPLEGDIIGNKKQPQCEIQMFGYHVADVGIWIDLIMSSEI
ncbi:hypothetical protein MPER_11713 [Moniliophthora perniciosa FA553]|nr:hypothetical protein MPER_11713 [Moniliophthora perniciosa FA553]